MNITTHFSLRYRGQMLGLAVILGSLFLLHTQPAQAKDAENFVWAQIAEQFGAQSGPDLVVSVNGPSEIEVGSVGILKLTVKNDSSHATNEVITFTASVDNGHLDVAKVVGVEKPAGVTCTSIRNLVTCNSSGLAAGASLTIKIKVQGVNEGELVEFEGKANLLANPSDRPENNEDSYDFEIVDSTKPKVSIVPVNFDAGYQLSVTGVASLKTGESYEISLDTSDDSADLTMIEWQPLTGTLSVTDTEITSLDLQIDITTAVNLTGTVAPTGTTAMAYLGLNAVPASGIASIGSPSMSECGMSAYVTPPPIHAADAADAGAAVRMQEQALPGGADLELECSEAGEVEWHDQPNVGFANIHVTFDESAFVRAANCSNDECAATSQQISLSISLQALPDVSAYLPLVY